MQSIYFCKKCSIDFPTVSRYIKHRKLFCELGRHETACEDHVDKREDNICKLTIAEASIRVKRAIDWKLKDLDPSVYQTVEEVERYKRRLHENGTKINGVRKEFLKKISDLKCERKNLEESFSEKSKRYESVKAYSKISSLEVTGVEELVDELCNLKNAILFLEKEIAENIEHLHQVESGNLPPPSDGAPALRTTTVATKSGTRESCRVTLPALLLATPALTPHPRTGTPRGVSTQRSATTQRVTSVPLRAATEMLGRAPSFVEDVPLSPSKPTTADSVVILGKLQRRREILVLQKEIQTMEAGEGMLRDNLLDEAALQPYIPREGLAVYIDYLTPTFHITANLILAVFRGSDIISQSFSYVVTPTSHLTYLGYHEMFSEIPVSQDTFLYASVQSLDGEELGWCLFNLFSDGTLNSGAWRLPLKSPPFSTDLISSLYHGVRSHNYSLRLRCSSATMHEAMLTAPKLKLAQYKLHNPLFQDNLILTANRTKQNQKISRAPSRDLVAETYGPPGDFDPIKALRRGGSSGRSTAMRMMPLARPARTPPASAPAPVRIKGLHYHTLHLDPGSLSLDPATSLTVEVELHEVDEEYHLVGSPHQLPASGPASLTTLHNHYFFNNQTIEQPWKQDDVVFLFTVTGSRGEVVCWSFLKYSDRVEAVEVYSPPVPSFKQLIEVIEEYECRESEEQEIQLTRLDACSFLVRYYDATEALASYPVRMLPDPPLSYPRLPTGAFRHVEQKANFTVHDPNKVITLVIDGARYLPSCVTISRVAGRIFDRNFKVVGPAISSGVVLESDVYNPTYKYSVAIPGDLPSTSIAALKIYSLHAATGQLTTVGYSIVNLFCKRGTTHPSDGEDTSMVLNAGPLQLPVHVDGPDAGKPLKMDVLQDVYRLPCAWLLIRLLYQAPDSPLPLMPSYNDGVYADNYPTLTTAETFVLDSHRQRHILPGSEACSNDPTPDMPLMRRLTRFKGQTVNDMAASDVLEYSPEFGFGVKVIGIKDFPALGSPLVYLRLCTAATLAHFTRHVVYNESVQFKKDDRVKWYDQIHYFTHVIPSTDVFVLVQVVEHRPKGYKTIGWAQVPIFAHTAPLTFVHKAIDTRLEISLHRGAPDLKSRPQSEDGAPYAVVEIFDSRYSSESKSSVYQKNPDYLQLAEEGLKFLASQQTKQSDFHIS